MVNVLLALMLGLYAPAGSIALPYLSFDAISPRSNRPGLELGYGLDLVTRDEQVLGWKARREVYMGALMAGLTWPIKRDASLGAGVKYRTEDDNLGGYVGLAVRFKAVEWSKPQP